MQTNANMDIQARVLAKHGIDFQLKEEQKRIIDVVIKEKKDLFCLLPTGFGKSLVYTLVPLILDEVSTFHFRFQDCVYKYNCLSM